VGRTKGKYFKSSLDFNNNDMEKDYLKIVLDGWLNLNNRNHLTSYFKRQMKTAESEFYSNYEFIDGCNTIVKAFETEMERRLFERQNELYMIIDRVESKDCEFWEVGGKKINRIKHIEELNNTVETIKKENYPVNLLHITNRGYFGFINYTELNFIKISLLSSWSEVEEEKPENLKPANEQQSEPIDKNHTTKLSAPIIRRFCELCNNSGLDKKDPNENVIPYCERICLKFGLEYSDRVRQNFDNRNEPKQTDNHLKKVIELILPTLKASDREIIDNYINPK
jgi:hypothetical protein